MSRYGADALTKLPKVRGRCEHARVPRPTRDLTKASFGEPWVTGDKRSGYTAQVMATFDDGRRSRVSRKGATSQAALDALSTAMTGGAPARKRTITMDELAASWEAAQRTPSAVVGVAAILLVAAILRAVIRAGITRVVLP